jgi:N-acetyl-gamma-glutamyl-phosphate reductase
MEAGVRCVDFSADYRFDDRAAYEAAYQPHCDPQNLCRAVYGIPELFRERIAGAELVGNPGCYPTSVVLGMAPVVRRGWIDGGVTVCSMSGVSGAGNKPQKATMFCECNEDVRAYKVGGHRHEPEMEHVLKLVGRPVPVTFVPHLVPIDRGILSTMTFRLDQPRHAQALQELYCEFYAGEPFVRVVAPGEQPRVKDVAFTNLCDIGVVVRDGGRVIVTAAIDNLMKGAASQAVQNMNVMMGVDETAGLL